MQSVELYIYEEEIFYSGEVTGNIGDKYISDSAANWITNQWVGYTAIIVSGTGVGSSELIEANSDKALTLVNDIHTDTTTIYKIVATIPQRIELFNDEKISLTSSVQNFNDLGKLFTDYSQSFTIPASKHNNKIFKHWYESSVGEQEDDLNLVEGTAFDHRRRYYGYIEIDTIPFRDGKFTMEKANKKNGFIESYTINFVGNLVQLKDKFKDDKINSLVDANGVSYYDELNFDYTYSNVADRIISVAADDNIGFPLIGSDRRFECNTGTPSDVLTTTGQIDYRTLFPAIRISKILEYIQAYYGLTFEGIFLNSATISDLWMYCKNAEEFNFYGEPLAPNFTSVSSGAFTQFNLATDTLTVSFNEAANLHRFESWIRITPTSSVEYNINVYDNGYLFASYTSLTGTQDIRFLDLYIDDEIVINNAFYTHNFTYTVTSVLPMTFDARVQLKRDYGHPITYYNLFANAYTQNTSGNLQIKKYLPDLKVEEFLTGIVKMFNLVIIPTAENTFEFKQLETWYQEGRIVDVTKFINQPEAEINKPKLYKRIDFKYEQSENVLNNAFRSLFNQEYGDLFYDNTNSAYNENYEVKVPFENIMWERYTDTTFLTATNWNKDLKAYTPKPVLMYDNGIQELIVGGSTDYYNLYDGTTNHTYSFYRRFSNEIYLGGTDTSYVLPLNWGAEQSTWTLQLAPRGLFNRYYANYIFNLYNQRTRVLKVKGLFTPYLLSTLKLNDRLVVSNKRYVINTLTTDLTTGEVELELLTDFRAEIQGVSQLRYSNIPQLSVDRTAQVVDFMIYKIDYDTFDVKVASSFLSYTTSTDNDGDLILTVTIPANATAADRDDAIELEYFKNGASTLIQIPVLQYA